MIAVVPLGLLKMRAFQCWTCCLSPPVCIASPWEEADGNRVLHASPGCWFRAPSRDLRGWGALCEDPSARGIWSASRRELHLNHLELLAVFLALKHFHPVLEGQHVLVRADNSTVLSYINRQGGTRSLQMLKLSCSLLLWCSVYFLSVRATHVPGHRNLGPDLLTFFSL